jgi:hypothetical protein
MAKNCPAEAMSSRREAGCAADPNQAACDRKGERLMKNQWLTTTLAVGLMAAFVVGCAEERRLGGGAVSPSGPSMETAERSERIATPTPALIGREVVNMQGERIGEVDAIAGDTVIVATGGFLGLGARRVALDSRQLTTIGSGRDLKLQTSLSQSQLEALPDVKDTGRERGMLRR